jgi:CRISPR type III-B/RAMP module-associated protein Cmr5
MRSLDQIRAAHAYAALDTASDEEAELARRLPDMLRTNGLLATWAFLIKKERDKEEVSKPPLLASVLEHLRSIESLAGQVRAGSPEEVFRAWIGTGQAPGIEAAKLRALTAESLALAGWLKRASEARASSGAGSGSEARRDA